MKESKEVRQRVVLMAIIAGIFHVKEDTSLRDIRLRIANSFSDMIDEDIMPGDTIDFIVTAAIKQYLEEERAIEEAKEILNSGI
jgi:hypothetical protein